MDVRDYAKYTIDNLSRATLSNALNISSKLDVQGGYLFTDFANNIYSYTITLLDSGKLNVNKCYDILSITNSALKKYNSNIKYNKLFIKDDYIINLWRVINGA